ncbi:P-loop containing nucleoside triphosphate hydrolase protein [Trametes polyzona]|nr:P-loop containing nucleoside triphosphate hydrolase protein [Trametes polyzona]
MNQDFCPATLFAGRCETLSCNLKHNAKFCSVCAVVCSPPGTYDAHVRGRQHQSNLATNDPNSELLCKLCNVTVSGQVSWSQHVSGAGHKQVAHAAGTSPAVYPCDPTDPSAYRCLICKRAVKVENWAAHLRSVTHQRQQKAALFRANFEQAEQDRQGVTVSHAGAPVDFGIVSREQARTGPEVIITVKANDVSSSVSIVKAECFGNGNSPSTIFSASIVGGPGKLVKGEAHRVFVSFRHSQRGRYQGRLELTLRDGTKRPFIVLRQLRVLVGNKDDHELLKAAAPYVHRKPAKWHPVTSIVEGDRPPALDAAKWVKQLLPSTIPAPLAKALSSGASRSTVRTIRNTFLPRVFDARSHGAHFQALLWIEEHRMVEDLRMYDMTDAKFTKDGRLYSLPVPGLAEKRPSVVVGYVHDVRLEDIRIDFHRSFDVSGKYVVRFQYNRTSLKREHQALLARSTSMERLLFPDLVHAPLERAVEPDESRLVLYNQTMRSNIPQLQAVHSVLKMKPEAPLIIFGPPGTGKTMTIVEAILQLLRKPDSRILACAPSNSAADLLAQRLAAQLPPTQLFRCNAVFREKLSLPDALVPYSEFRQNHFALPSLTKLKAYRVVVSTCNNASFAYNVGIPAGHFTHIFVDEAGQGSEPEVLTAGIKTMVTDNTKVVLSGDPQQLGPVVRSSIAWELGLDKSYLERLMQRPLYSNPKTGRGRSYIKLVKNFRSHEAILAYPNERFYNGELEVCGAPAQITSLLDSDVLVSPTFPVVFHAIAGENEREASSPSYFNIDEATEVVEYVKDILNDRKRPVRPTDIGVITPYFAQVRKIRTLLRKSNISDVKVASVEEFQGQERRVIIISTVRTNRELLSYDAKFTLGFVSNPRRFNVAVTRAQALLVVIGDPSILCVDPMWRGFMNYVHARGGWRGEPPTWDTTAPVRIDGTYASEMREAAAAEMDALIARLADGEDVEGEANYDRAFREPE